MANTSEIFRNNFLEYASYVIKERAIPDIEDGFKPVQRRIIHTLIEMDDGRFHKVANVVGSAMHYHPHGDASIYTALVNLANYDLFIEKQGNYGNFLTGDVAAAARYIECRLLPFAKKVLYNPEITEYVDSYDGRSKEPVVFRAKIPVVLIQGTEGIAVGMRTTILPHNPIEVLNAQINALKGKEFELYPDFPGGGIMDVSDYQDGLGSVLVRAKLNVSNPKKVVIEELPFGITSEAMIQSIEEAAKKGQIKVAEVSDFTAERVNIEIYPSKGINAEDIVEALYAYTDCEYKITVNPLVIKDGLPHIISISDIVKYHADHIINVSKAELEVEKNHILNKLHRRTLERIFIEERIYKRIESRKTQEGIIEAIKTGFVPFSNELIREITDEDIDALLKIPIRRISLYDMEKNRQEIEQLNEDLNTCDYNLKHLVKYSVNILSELKHEFEQNGRVRKTELQTFSKVDVRDIAKRDYELKYDEKSGYVGISLKTGEIVCKVSIYDKILTIDKTGAYSFINVPEKQFVGRELNFLNLAEKDFLEDTVFTVIYREKECNQLFIKRVKLNMGYIANKVYYLIPDADNNELVGLFTYPEAQIIMKYRGKTKAKVPIIFFSDFVVRGVKAKGYLLTKRDIATIKAIPMSYEDTLKIKKENGVEETENRDNIILVPDPDESDKGPVLF